MIGIVVSRADAASSAIGEALRSIRNWDRSSDGETGEPVYRSPGFELRYFDAWHLHLENVAAEFSDPTAIVFASRHSGDTGRLLTTHFTGNFGPAEAGGRDNEVARTCPNLHAELVATLDRHAPDGYRIGIECTHHGPTSVGVPSLFAEIGSGPDEWADPAAARAVARAILAVGDTRPHRRKQLVGFGGGHYANRFERIVRETDWAVGHIAAEWGLEAIGDPKDHTDLLESMFHRSWADHALIVDDHPDLERVIEELGYRVVSETWVRTVSKVSLATAERLESAVGRIDDGVRFGQPAADLGSDDRIEIVTLPNALLEKARTVDAGSVRSAVEGSVCAFETAEGATKAAGRAAVTDHSQLDQLIDEVCAILARSYSVERTTDSVVVTEERFDPDRARALGVEEGPQFGRLADGEPIAVDGRTVTPEEVHEAHSTRFTIP